MKVIAPHTITEAMLTSSTLPETEYSAWSSGTGYTTGQRAIKVENWPNGATQRPDRITAAMIPPILISP